jgi:hypothetical protein
MMKGERSWRECDV